MKRFLIPFIFVLLSCSKTPPEPEAIVIEHKLTCLKDAPVSYVDAPLISECRISGIKQVDTSTQKRDGLIAIIGGIITFVIQGLWGD